MHELFKDQLRDDLFDWAAARATLQAAVRGLPTPGCVALYGAWGAGKTTALRHLQADLDKTNSETEKNLATAQKTMIDAHVGIATAHINAFQQGHQMAQPDTAAG